MEASDTNSTDPRPQKPQPRPIDVSRIPDALILPKRWVMWRYEFRDDDWTKPPYQANGRKAKSTDSDTWWRFHQVREAYETGEFDGIGFTLDPSLGMVGIDLDHCVRDGELEDWAASIVSQVRSYTEISPSGEGIRIIAKGDLPEGRRKKGNVEMYNSGRYLTITGHHLKGTPFDVIARSTELAQVHADHLGTEDDNGSEQFDWPEPATPVDASDRELIDAALASKGNFSRLWHGDDSTTEDKTPSAGDQALINRLAFWCGGDHQRMDRIFRQSPRMRPKWNRGDYRDRTITKALQKWDGEPWTPPGDRSRVTLTRSDVDDCDHDPGRGLPEPGQRHDTGNAEMLAYLHGHRMRYVPRWNAWLVWSGVHWEQDYREVLLTARAEDVGRTLLRLASDIDDADKQKAAVRWAMESLGAHRIKNMIVLARSQSGIAIDHETLDTDGWLLGVENGVVDLKTGQFRDADPDDLMTVQAPVSWDENAECPTWEKCLVDWFPDPDTRAYFQLLCGLSLVGAQIEHIFAIFIGDGGNGKGTAVRAIENTLGPYAATPPLALLVETKWGAHDTATSTLFRARLAVASETERRVKLAESSIKNLTGGDRIKARRLYENPWEFNPTHTLWLQTNHLPEIQGRDAGIWRRIKVVPWVANFTKNPDRDLDNKLAREATGILRWMVDGCLLWQQAGGLVDPPQVVNATLAYRQAEDAIGRWMTETGLVLRDGLSIPALDLTKSWSEWVDENLGGRRRFNEIADHLENQGCRKRTRKFRDDQGKQRQVTVWKGIGYSDPDDDNQRQPSQESDTPEVVTPGDPSSKNFSNARVLEKVSGTGVNTGHHPDPGCWNCGQETIELSRQPEFPSAWCADCGPDMSGVER